MGKACIITPSQRNCRGQGGGRPCAQAIHHGSETAAQGPRRRGPALRRAASWRGCSHAGTPGGDLLRRPGLDDPAAVHHRHAAAEIAHDTDVAADEAEAPAESLPRVQQRIEHPARLPTSSVEVTSSATISFTSTATAKKLSASTAITTAALGGKSRGAAASRWMFCASLSSTPREMAGGWRSRPRRESRVLARIMQAVMREAKEGSVCKHVSMPARRHCSE